MKPKNRRRCARRLECKRGDREMKFHRFVAFGLAVALALLSSTGLAVAAAKPASEAKVNLNTASVEQLVALPGVGQKLAARIVEYRQKAGGFLPYLHYFEKGGSDTRA